MGRVEIELKSEYMVIDLKSFFASVECVERGLDPFTTNLVVADPDREKGTLCLAITPAMKALGVKNRCRVYEIPKEIDYIMASPRMQLYIDYSAEIYGIYLKYIAKEDIHVYSIDEAFLDVSNYREYYNMSAKEIGQMIIGEVFRETGITATCGIGTNMYLAKIALDITAKHSKDHIGILNEEIFCKTLWNHRPLTDFWRIGPGTAERLKRYDVMCMRDLAKLSEYDEDLLYKVFGIDAELLIDHAFGKEPVTMKDIKTYRPQNTSLSCGQVLLRDYEYSEAKLIVKEMLELLCLDLVAKGLITDSITLYVGYSHTVLYPSAKGTVSFSTATSSAVEMRKDIIKLYEKIVHRNIPIRRINLCCNRVIDEIYEQYDLFLDPVQLHKERDIQKAMIEIKERFGKNAVLKGMNLLEAGTTIARNGQIGGHKSG